MWGQGGASGGEGRMRSDGAAEGRGGATLAGGPPSNASSWCEGQQNERKIRAFCKKGAMRGGRTGSDSAVKAARVVESLAEE